MLEWIGPLKDVAYLIGVILIVSGVIYKIRRDIERGAENVEMTKKLDRKIDEHHEIATEQFTALQDSVQTFQQETRLTTQHNALRIEQQDSSLQKHLDECREDKRELRKELSVEFNRLHEKINGVNNNNKS